MHEFVLQIRLNVDGTLRVTANSEDEAIAKVENMNAEAAGKKMDWLTGDVDVMGVEEIG